MVTPSCRRPCRCDALNADRLLREIDRCLRRFHARVRLAEFGATPALQRRARGALDRRQLVARAVQAARC